MQIPHLRRGNPRRPGVGGQLLGQVGKGAIGTAQFLELLVERGQKLVVEPGADLPGEEQFALLIIADEDGAKMGAGAFGLGVAADDKFLFVASI